MAVRFDGVAQTRAVPRRHAQAWAWQLEIRAKTRQAFVRPARTIATVCVLAVLAVVAGDAALANASGVVAALLVPMNLYPFTTGFFTALIAFTRLCARRRHAERDHAASWLASAPIEPSDVRAFLRWRAIVATVPIGVIVVAVVAMLGWTHALDVRMLCVALGTGLATGAVAGWRKGARASSIESTPLPRLRDRVDASTAVAGFDALQRWPFAQLLASADPRRHARIVAALLLAMPMGAPLSVVVPLLLLLATGLGAVGLLQALLTTIPRAADVLRSTPLPLPRWVSPLGARVVVCQVVAAAMAALLACMLGASAGAALVGAIGWILWVAFAMLCAIAVRDRPARLRGELVAYAIVLIGFAVLAPFGLLVVLPTLAAWQWRRAGIA